MLLQWGGVQLTDGDRLTHENVSVVSKVVKHRLSEDQSQMITKWTKMVLQF